LAGAQSDKEPIWCDEIVPRWNARRGRPTADARRVRVPVWSRPAADGTEVDQTPPADSSRDFVSDLGIHCLLELCTNAYNPLWIALARSPRWQVNDRSLRIAAVAAVSCANTRWVRRLPCHQKRPAKALHRALTRPAHRPRSAQSRAGGAPAGCRCRPRDARQRGRQRPRARMGRTSR
jgi:hypothetical protein